MTLEFKTSKFRLLIKDYFLLNLKQKSSFLFLHDNPIKATTIVVVVVENDAIKMYY